MIRALATIALLLPTLAAAAENKLAATQGAPDGLSKGVAAAIDRAGHKVVGDGGVVCEVWLAKAAEVKAEFKPTLAVNYPFASGQLLGVLRVGKAGTFTDFRGQEVAAGVYTLRYGQQPEDGNHIGTSELRDFLLAIPAKVDTDPKPVKVEDMLHKQSAKSAGSTHPAIFSLLPAKKAKGASLKHDADHEFWILQAGVSGKKKGKPVIVPLRMVVIGKSEG